MYCQIKVNINNWLINRIPPSPISSNFLPFLPIHLDDKIYGHRHPLIHVHFRENSDRAVDTETVHEIKTIHLPPNTGDHYDSGGQKSDFAVVELLRSVNICSPEETKKGLCWRVTPVRLPDPSINIRQLQKVRTMGNNVYSHAISY